MSDQHAPDVVIPFAPSSGTRPGSLVAVLSSLTAHPCIAPERIVIAANGHLDRAARAELKTVRTRWPATTVLGDRLPSRARARNHAASLGTATYIMFCDADMVPHPSLLTEVLARAKPDSFLCGARRRYLPITTPMSLVHRLIDERRWDPLDRLATEQPARSLVSPYAQMLNPRGLPWSFVTAFGLVPRSLFSKVGGFDHRY